MARLRPDTPAPREMTRSGRSAPQSCSLILYPFAFSLGQPYKSGRISKFGRSLVEEPLRFGSVRAGAMIESDPLRIDNAIGLVTR